MDTRKDLYYYHIFAVFAAIVFISCSAQSSTNVSADSLDSALRDYAFGSLSGRSRTGVLYDVPLPANLSAVEVSVVRLRTGSIWARGANYSMFSIPPRTTTVPYVRRMVLVSQNLGNLSSSYYNVPPGYSLVTPVYGLLAYDATINNISSGIRQVDLNATVDPISVTFPEAALPLAVLNSTARCVRFGLRGSVDMNVTETTSYNTCSTRRNGHFAIVVPAVSPGRSPDGGGPVVVEEPRGEGREWWVLVVACGGGVVGLGLVGLGIFRFVRNKKMEVMESRAEEGEVLGTVWVGGSKMPTAAMVRTKPVLETGN